MAILDCQSERGSSLSGELTPLLWVTVMMMALLSRSSGGRLALDSSVLIRITCKERVKGRSLILLVLDMLLGA